MKKNRLAFFLLSGMVLAAVLGIVQYGRVSASQYDQKIRQARQQEEEYTEKAEELSEQLEELEKDKKNVLKYLEKLDKETIETEERIEELGEQIEKTSKELAAEQTALSEAEAILEQQYNTMKKRIQYMYEKGNREYLEILMASGSISEFLSRAEYIEKISAYDKQILNGYQQTKTQIETKKTEIAQRLESLQEMEKETEEERDALTLLKERKKKQIKKFNRSMKKKQKQADDYARAAAKAEEDLERLLKQKQAQVNNTGYGTSDEGQNTSLRWPLRISGRISSPFGQRTSPTAGASSYHKGVDIAAASGTPVVSAAAGTVVTAAYSASAGNYIMISHKPGLSTVYMHCSRLAVREGEQVEKGQVIGYVGSTGISTGAHLHFGVLKNGEYVDPMSLVSR